MGIRRFTRARDHLLAIDEAETSLNDVAEAILVALHDLARFECGAVVTVDSETLLPHGAVVEGFLPEHCQPFWDNELLDADFNKFTDLAGRSDPVATLYDAVDGDLDRSPRFRKLYAPAGACDELRVAFTTSEACVGHATLVRLGADEPFTPDEQQDVRDLAPVATRVLLRAAGRALASSVHDPPVVLILDAEGKVRSMSDGGEALIAELRTPSAEEPGLPIQVQAAATRARWSRTSARLATRVRGRDGRWLRLYVTPMADDPGAVAVTIERARPSDLVPIILQSYGLTQRETDVVLHLARGRSAKEIAAAMCISAHTVRDHIKVIYDKAGVTGRGELVARLFSDHCLADFHDATVHLPPRNAEQRSTIGA
ncbi:MAG: helix-turn-helix transcriptional regulator [Acidimicrobiia bacterium]|nr:helix-turn-helix transcriptional regulator [Acidimicrobiia bacterium]